MVKRVAVVGTFHVRHKNCGSEAIGRTMVCCDGSFEIANLIIKVVSEMQLEIKIYRGTKSV